MIVMPTYLAEIVQQEPSDLGYTDTSTLGAWEGDGLTHILMNATTSGTLIDQQISRTTWSDLTTRRRE